MPLTDAGRNKALDGLDEGIAGGITHLALLDDTLTEIAGAPYAREAVTWGAAASGQKSNSGDVTHDVPGGATVAAYGLASHITTGDGKDLGWLPNGGFAPQAATADASTDTFESFAHGLSNGDRVFLYDVQAAGLPTGLSESVLYHVVGITADTLQVSLTNGGAAVNFTTSGEVVLQKVTVETYGADGTITAAAAAVVLDGRLV